MLIRKAEFTKLHGHITRALTFKPGVNIIIGINGSGKTAMLNALAWTLSPQTIQSGVLAAYSLSQMEFEKIVVSFSVPKKRSFTHITATKSAHAVVIEVSELEGTFEIPIVYRDETHPLPYSREGSEHIERLSSYLEQERHNPVLQYLADLPGALYLPLNRRWPEDVEPERATSRSRRTATFGQLPISIVLSSAERAYASEQRERIRLNDELRNKFLASFFDIRPRSLIISPVWTIDEINVRRSRIDSTLEGLGLDNANEFTGPYFERLESLVEGIAGRTVPPFHDIQNDEQSEQWYEWIFAGSEPAQRAESIIQMIEEYEANVLNVTKRTRDFLASVNAFLADNGKRLFFSQDHTLDAILPNGQTIRATHLSSGETQLLILFTFLYFLFDPELQFPILVDEPELSLHVVWQNRYLKSITDANPNVQFIVATHSPEIAGEFTDRITDISPKVGSIA